MKAQDYVISSEKFKFASNEGRLHDQKLATKPIGYFRDAWLRFRKNKASVVAACIILLLVLYAIIGPFLVDTGYQNSYATSTILRQYKYLPPKLGIFSGTGFWDGTSKTQVSINTYESYVGMEMEMGIKVIVDEFEDTIVVDPIAGNKTLKNIRIDNYKSISVFTITFTESEYKAMQEWQKENNLQVILPWVENETSNYNIWYQCDRKGNAIKDGEGNFVPAYATTGPDDYDSLRLATDPFNSGETDAAWRYAKRSGTIDTGYNYMVRVNPTNYFIYTYGFEPSFVFGTNVNGYDILSRLASGARFSFILAILVSAVNLTIGAIYGAIEGYYGGLTDLLMERFSDILNGVPFMVVTVLFQLHLASKVGIVPSLIYAFVLTGWIGMASRVRMQFYRFKNQEYVLAARTLGASDRRIMFKHIFPNSLGTIITGSVLVIPGVIFSETSLSYLGIINLNSATMSSVGAMLSEGQQNMSKYPHAILFPALFISLLMISFNLFGNGLRDAFNPSLRGAEE